MAENENQPSERTVPSGGIPWDVIAQSSLIFAAITGVLFLIGWAYHSGWYGYYGISLTQVDIPIQHIFIQSYVPLLILLSTLAVSMVIYSIGRSVVAILKAGGFKRTYLHSYDSVAREFSATDWIGVLLIDALLNYEAFHIIFDFMIRSFNLQMNAINEFVYYGSSMFMGIVAIGLALFLLIGVIVFFRSGIRYKELIKVIGVLLPIHPPKLIWVFGLFLVNIIIAMSISQRYGVVAAALGVEGFGGWKVQTVNLTYPGDLDTPDWMKLGCEQTRCSYGPFGLVAENADSYILVPWVRIKKSGGLIPSNIFIIPKSDQVHLAPNDQSAILPPAPTPTP